MKTVKVLRTLVLAAVLSAVVFPAGEKAYAAVDISMDATVGCIASVNSTTLTVNHIYLPGYNATVWVDFQWDRNNLVFYPVNAGIEYSGTKNFKGTMTDWVTHDVYDLAFAIDADTREIYLTFTATNGSPWTCEAGWYFKQGGKEVDDGYPGLGGDTFIVSTYDSWGACGSIQAGATKKARLYAFPAWFDFGKPFTFGQADEDFNELNIP